MGQGELLLFPSASRPVQGKRGILRASMRHGLSRVEWGERYALGLIFSLALGPRALAKDQAMLLEG